MLSVDQYLITITMAILILLMKLSSKYMKKPQVKLHIISQCISTQINILSKRKENKYHGERSISFIIFLHSTLTVTHTTANALANRYGIVEVLVKRKMLCSYMFITCTDTDQWLPKLMPRFLGL